MDIEEFDWLSGHVEHWSLGRISADRPLRGHHRWDLKEDLALVRFPGGICIDVGWYPEGSFDGHFVVQVVADGDWHEPVIKKTYATVEDLARGMSEAVVLADRTSSGRTSRKGIRDERA